MTQEDSMTSIPARRRPTPTLVILLSLALALPLLSAPAFAGRPGGRRGDMGRAGMRSGARGPGARGRGRIGLAPSTPFEAAYMQWNEPYKRSLLLTSRGNEERAKELVAAAQAQWFTLLDAYYLTPPAEFAEDPLWRTDLAAVTGYLQLAQWQLYSGDMGAAHDSLEPIRRLWLDLRERNEVPWFGDRLTRYHDLMEPVVMWATGAAHGGVTPDNIDEFDEQLKTLATAWGEIADAARRLRVDNRRPLDMILRQNYDALKALDDASAEARYDDLPDAARAVRSAFIQLYMRFG